MFNNEFEYNNTNIDQEHGPKLLSENPHQVKSSQQIKEELIINKKREEIAHEYMQPNPDKKLATYNKEFESHKTNIPIADKKQSQPRGKYVPANNNNNEYVAGVKSEVLNSGVTNDYKGNIVNCQFEKHYVKKTL